MARGISDKSVLIPGTGGLSVALYDEITRRNARDILGYVPSLFVGADANLLTVPADRYYGHAGGFGSTTTPVWVGDTQGTYNGDVWDATYKRSHITLIEHASAPGQTGGTGAKFYPLGLLGTSPSFAPKAASVTTLRLRFVARFTHNQDYETSGVGLGGSFTATSHFVQVLRNGASWELGSGDGSSVSQSSGGTADANWHEYEVRWTTSGLTLLVDGSSTITKSSNLPAEPISFRATAMNVASPDREIDIADILVDWLV